MRPSITENAAHRSFQACLECRRSKLKCDGLQSANNTCSRCKQRGKECVWPGGRQLHIALQTPQNDPYPITSTPSSQREPSVSAAETISGTPASSSQAQFAAPGATPSSSARHQRQGSNSRRQTRGQEVEGPNGAQLPSNSKDPNQSNKRSRSNSGNQDSIQSNTRRRSEQNRSLRDLLSHSQIVPSVSLSDLALLSPNVSSSRKGKGRQKDAQGDQESQRDHESSNDNTNGVEDVRDVDNDDVNSSGNSSSSSDSDQDEDATTSSSTKRNIDEQILALQDRMGWSQSNLKRASEERRVYFKEAFGKEPVEQLRRLDPLATNLLSTTNVEHLFRVFFDAINVQHCFLDPSRDTWQSIQKKSAALFITICAVSASIDQSLEHALSPTCVRQLITNHQESLDVIFAHNVKSPEAVKMLLLSFLFMQKPSFARQDKCWTYIDTAARIASELDLGQRLQTPIIFASDPTNIQQPVDQQKDQEGEDIVILQKRSDERAWATAALMQRSLGTFTGLGSTVSIHIEWNRLNVWSENPLAIVGDVQHAAYLQLRRIETYAQGQVRKLEKERFFSLESIRVGFNTLFIEWQENWIEHPVLASQHACRSYLALVGLHIRLYINVTALQLAHQAAAFTGERRKARAMYRVHPDLERLCANYAFEFCQFFLDNFEHRAHHLGRNMVSMVTWSVLVLLQLRYAEGRLLAARVAVLLAGFSGQTEEQNLFANSYSRFYGRWLLSLINDLRLTSSQQKAVSLLRGGLHARRSQDKSGQEQSWSQPDAQEAQGEGSRPQHLDADRQPQQNVDHQQQQVQQEQQQSDWWQQQQNEEILPVQQLQTHQQPMWQASPANLAANGQETARQWQNVDLTSFLAQPNTLTSTNPFNDLWLASYLDNLDPSASNISLPREDKQE